MSQIDAIVKKLRYRYSVKHRQNDPFKVLISTVLSQRTKDENTHKASQKLFRLLQNPEAIANADVETLAELIKPAGFYRQKAKRIKEISRIIIDDYAGIIPDDISELLKLPGVGRKTANCVLVYGYNKDALPVDTHVHRIANRLGLTDTNTPEETEQNLRMTVPKTYWKELNSLLIKFGKEICKPQTPNCQDCPLYELCPRNF
jgi:endonuclease-3